MTSYLATLAVAATALTTIAIAPTTAAAAPKVQSAADVAQFAPDQWTDVVEHRRWRHGGHIRFVIVHGHAPHCFWSKRRHYAIRFCN